MMSNSTTDTSSRNRLFPYHETIGTLLYLTNKTRPELSYAVNYGSRKMENPSETEVTNLKRILKYLNTYPDDGLKYNRNSNLDELTAFCDSDFAGDLETRKSTGGFVIFYCGGPIAWCSRKQPLVALSSTEAEYIAAAECTKELIYMKALIEELIGINVKVTVNVDNQSAIKMVRNGQMNKRSKHIDVRFFCINEKVKEGLLKLQYCCTENQIADILTKPVDKNKFSKIKSLLLFEN